MSAENSTRSDVWLVALPNVDKRIPYMEAVVWYCEQNNMEVEVAAKLLNAIIKAKIEAEAVDLNFLTTPKGSKLPI